MTTEATSELSPKERLWKFQQAMTESDRRWRGRKPNNHRTGTSLAAHSTDPFIVSRRGEEFADSNDPDFFPKAFPCLFPWGRGGPKALGELGNAEERDQTAEAGRQTEFKPKDHYLKPWARYLLQRHGAKFATHPTFAFLVFNMLVRSENRRVSYLRMSKASFPMVEQIISKITAEDIEKASEEYRETRTTTNPRIAFLMREISAYGNSQHMSNEERLSARRKIQALCLKHGMPCVWYTINPNDLTNEVNMKLAAHRIYDGPKAEALMEELRRQVRRIQHLVRDPVSSAQFFHREIQLFFQHCVAIGEESIFGKVSAYFGCVETNERGALHLHGFLWLDANIEMPNLFRDVEGLEGNGYAEQVCQYLDSVFSECCDEARERQYRHWDSVFSDITNLTQDLSQLAEVYDDEANWVAYRCQMHSCGATCTKYSFKDKAGGAGGHPCRFRAPWKEYDRTEFHGGLLHMKRNHPRINRYCPAMTVAMRHNTDATFLP
ncbi:hypothetical protein CSOJ01_16073, partial [Colletotrichum sojae]